MEGEQVTVEFMSYGEQVQILNLVARQVQVQVQIRLQHQLLQALQPTVQQVEMVKHGTI